MWTDQDLLKFAHSIKADENGLVYAGAFADSMDVTATTVIGDDVYVLIRKEEMGIYNFIYKINLKTNQTEKIVGTSVNWFRIVNEKLYYVKSEDRFLYAAALDGKGETKVSARPVSWFDNVGDRIFYTMEGELHKIDPADNGTLVSKLPVAGVAVIDGKLLCELQNNEGFVILDASGNFIVKVTEPITRVLPSDKVFVQLARDALLQFIR